MTAKAYNLLKELKPRIVDYKQDNNGPDDPNAKVIVTFACSKEQQKGLEGFIKACNEGNDEDTAEIVGNSVSSTLVKVVSDSFFTDSIVADFF